MKTFVRSLRIVVVLALFGVLAPTSSLSQEPLPEGHAPVSDEALARALGEGPPITESAPSAAVPVGVVDVIVIDENGAPVPGARVRLGTMANGSTGGQRFEPTDATGHARFAPAASAAPAPSTGVSPNAPARTAHRVTLEYQGAKYLTAPFVLGPTMGQAVLIRRLPTSTDTRVLLQRIGQTILEFQKPGRVHVSQSADLINLGASTLVLPRGGLPVPLPEGFLALESEPSMNDQRIVPDARGFTLQGSIPPGRFQLRYTFDLPFSGDELEFRQRVAFHQTAAYQIIVDAAAGMQLDVRGFPASRFVEYQGKNLLVTERELTPEEAPLRDMRVRLTGIPGPGPYRFIAIALGLVGLALGVRLATSQGDAAEVAAAERARRSTELLDEIARLAAEHASGDVGDAFFARERERVVEELALLARHDALAAAANSANSQATPASADARPRSPTANHPS